MKNFKLILSITLVNILLISCNSERSRPDKISAMINGINSPFLITTLTPQNLIDKSGIEDGVLSYTEQTFVSFFISSQNTGIENTEQIQVVLGKGSGMTPDVYSIFKLNNAKTFEDLIKKELNEDIHEKDGFKYFVYDNLYVVAWQGEFAVGCNTSINLASMLGEKNSSSSKTVNKCISVLKSGDQGETNPIYNSILANTNDFSLFFDTKNIFSYLKSMKVLNSKDLKKYEEKYGNTTFESTLNFEKGKIIFNQDFVLTDFLKEQLGFINNKGIDSDLFDYGKSENPLLSYSIHVNPIKTLDYLKNELSEKELTKLTNDLNTVGLSIDELAESFSGQALIMIDGVTTKTELIDLGYGEPFTSKSSEPVVGAVFGIKDNSIFNKLPESITVSQTGFMTFENELFGCLTDELFFISNDSNWVSQVMMGNTIQVNEHSVLTDNPYGVYAINNLDDYKHLLESNMEIVTLFTKAYGFANLEHSNFTIELKNTSDNALKVISKFLSEMRHEIESEFNKNMQDMLEDEILDETANTLMEVEKALDNADVSSLMTDVLNEVNK